MHGILPIAAYSCTCPAGKSFGKSSGPGQDIIRIPVIFCSFFPRSMKVLIDIPSCFSVLLETCGQINDVLIMVMLNLRVLLITADYSNRDGYMWLDKSDF